jgi:hypothetical protein
MQHWEILEKYIHAHANPKMHTLHRYILWQPGRNVHPMRSREILPGKCVFVHGLPGRVLCQRDCHGIHYTHKQTHSGRHEHAHTSMHRHTILRAHHHADLALNLRERNSQQSRLQLNWKHDDITACVLKTFAWKCFVLYMCMRKCMYVYDALMCVCVYM